MGFRCSRLAVAVPNAAFGCHSNRCYCLFLTDTDWLRLAVQIVSEEQEAAVIGCDSEAEGSRLLSVTDAKVSPLAVGSAVSTCGRNKLAFRLILGVYDESGIEGWLFYDLDTGVLLCGQRGA